MYSIARLAADNASADPTHAMTLSADAIRLYSPTLHANMDVFAPPDVSCSLSVSGPGGRDASPFVAMETVWFYYIGADSLPLSTTVSRNPPKIGPALSGGYTHFAPAFPMLIADDCSLQLKVLMWPPSSNPARTITRIRGDRAWYANAIYYDFPDFFPVALPGYPPPPMRVFDFSWAVPAGAATINLTVDAEIHQAPGPALISGFILSWAQVGGVNQNDVNVSLYQPELPYTFPTVQDLVADFPVGPLRQLWGTYSVASGGVTSTDFCAFVRGYSW